jgi:molybdopterin-guanine dinucleotide biosynthesis protein B
MRFHLAGVSVPILGFAAASGTGKTTLLKSVIPALRAEGLRVGVIKHTHHDVEMDRPGKDSYDLRQAGASPVLLASHSRRVILWDRESPSDPRLLEEIAFLEPLGLDLVLVEGFRHEQFPKIEIHRALLGHPLLYPDDPSIIALVSDQQSLNTGGLPWLNLNQPTTVIRFIVDVFLLEARREIGL